MGHVNYFYQTFYGIINDEHVSFIFPLQLIESVCIFASRKILRCLEYTFVDIIDWKTIPDALVTKVFPDKCAFGGVLTSFTKAIEINLR